jgi:hypothetical protein
MSEQKQERFYRLLPAIYRQRDKQQGEPLRMLLDALESEFHIVEADIDALYDNWFIETCDEWVLPYIADQVGVFTTNRTDGNLFASQRRQIANTIAYRRRKGLAAVLEHVLQDVTGWYARVIEYSSLLASTQHLHSVNKERGRLIDVRSSEALATLDGPFDILAHNFDVKHTGTDAGEAFFPALAVQGTHHPDTIGIFLWRLQCYLVTNVPALPVTSENRRVLPPGCFTFDPLGRAIALFNLPLALTEITQRTAANNLPGPIHYAAFAADLAAYKISLHSAIGEGWDEEQLAQNSLYYGPERSLCVLLNGAPISPGAIISADLSHWQMPSTEVSRQHEYTVAIDALRGRLAFLGHKRLTREDIVEVNYCYGFSGDMGSGPYMRSQANVTGTTCHINVLHGGQVATLGLALAQWEEYCQEHASQEEPVHGIIHIVDNGLYAEGNLVIKLPKNGRLIIEAAEGVRPILQTALAVHSQSSNASLLLSGLFIVGELSIVDILRLDIEHCTLMPHGLKILHSSQTAALLYVTLDHSIVGPIRLYNRHCVLRVQDSIIDHQRHEFAIDAMHTDREHGSGAFIQRTTIFGKVQLYSVEQVQDVIFTELVLVKNCISGLVSFSYLPPHSQTPQRVFCQPEHDQNAFPLFHSVSYGDAAYAQLDVRCSPRILRGAANGAEIGAFNSLRQIQRQDNLYHILDEYLPYGLTADISYVT